MRERVGDLYNGDFDHFPHGSFYEVKAVKGNSKGEYPLTAQIKGMLNALSEQKNIKNDKKTSDEYAGVFVLVTYSNVEISDAVIEKAEELDIHLFQVKAYYDDETGLVDFGPFERKASSTFWEKLSTGGDDWLKEATLEGVLKAKWNLREQVPFDWKDAERNAGMSNEEEQP